MKKLLALLAVVLAVVSCQKEINGLAVDRNGEAEFTVSVGLSEDVTRAAGVDSAKGGINNVKVEDYDLRYILEVYDENGALAKERMVNYTDADETSTSFQLRLVPGRGYKFVAWADFVRKGTKADYHYNTSAGLTNITIQGTQSAMNESRDAYTEMTYISNFDSKSVINMTLTRPFAKLRIVTTDMKELYSDLTSATIQYTVPLYNSFNALTETASGEATDVTKTVNYGATTIYTNENPDESGKMTLYADYFFGAEEGKVHFTLDVKDATNFNIPTVTFNTDIPVQRNFLTTIYGPVLTDANNVTVTIDAKFDGEKTYPDEKNIKEQLEFAAICGGEVTLTKDVTLDKPLFVDAGAHLILNLKGHTIENTTNSLEYGVGEAIVVYGKLTIKDYGVVKGSTRAIWARGDKGAEVNIYDGLYVGCKSGYTGGGNSVIYASSGNTINIYGGTFMSQAADKTSYADKTNGVYAALNIADNNGNINVYGGKFYKQNPAAPGTEPASWNNTHPNGFVANGYGSYRIGDYYEVKKPSEAVYSTNGNSVADYELIKNIFRHGGKLTINESITYGDIKVTEALIADGVNVEITGAGEIYLKDGVNTIYEQGVVSAVICAKNGGTVTFNNYSGYVDGGANDYAVEVRDGGKVVINSGNFKGAVSAVYAVNGAVEINGGEFWANDSTYGAIYLLNCSDANYVNQLASIVVKGGEYHGFNPAANAAEGNGTNFVAPGYESVEDNGVWTVKESN